MHAEVDRNAGDAAGRGKRDAIVSAAVAEFQAHGFADARMDRIAERAQVSKRTLYKHFEGKEALFRAIVDRMVDSFREARETPFDPGRPLREQLEALGWTEGRLFLDAGFMAQVRMLLAEAARDAGLSAELDARLAACGPFRRFYAGAAAAGALGATDPEAAALQHLGLLKGRLFWPALHAGRAPSREEVEMVVTQAADLLAAAWRS